MHSSINRSSLFTLMFYEKFKYPLLILHFYSKDLLIEFPFYDDIPFLLFFLWIPFFFLCVFALFSFYLFLFLLWLWACKNQIPGSAITGIYNTYLQGYINCKRSLIQLRCLKVYQLFQTNSTSGYLGIFIRIRRRSGWPVGITKGNLVRVRQ